MNEHHPEPLDSDAALQLLRLAGPRSEPVQERRDRVRAAVRGQWQATLAARRRRIWVAAGATLAAAASVVLAIVLPRLGTAPATAAVGHVEVVRGQVSWRRSGATRALSTDTAIVAGTEIRTFGDGRTALRLGNASVRMDTDSTLAIEQAQQLRLERGAVYVDNPSAGGSGGVVVATPRCRVHEIGTQFEVRMGAEELRVRVREGRVRIERNSDGRDEHEVAAGWEVVVDASGSLERRPVTAADRTWDWLLQVAPSFLLEGSTAAELLSWVSRETGRSVRWARPGLARRAGGMVLHGDMDGVRPDKALDLVLPTCGLEHREEGGVLVVYPMTP